MQRGTAPSSGSENGTTENASNVPESNGESAASGQHTSEAAGGSMDLALYSHLLPTRWWLASTAFPLIAGTFGPVANAFSICALVEHWRNERLPGGSTIQINDPKWALAINGLSLAFALISNLSLVLNMTRRLRFTVAQPITIGGWYISSILLICLVAAMRYATNMTNREMAQSYYYAIIAAATYLFISTLLLMTVYGAWKRHYSHQFGITDSQRSLMLQTITLIAYMLVGAAIYAQVEDWRFLDAVYWADFTLLTVGIGDIAPTTQVGRGLLFPYAVGGIISLAIVVNSIRTLLIDRIKRDAITRRTELTRRVVAEQVLAGRTGRCGLIQLIPDASTASEAELQEEEFYLMRRIHSAAGNEIRFTTLALSLTAWMALWFLGALAFHLSEKEQDWSYFDGLYFCYTSLLTIGYGDIAPKDGWGRPFFVFWSLLAVPTMTILFSSIGDTVAKFLNEATILIGELTFLPGESGYKATVQTAISQIKARRRRKGHYPVSRALSDLRNTENLAPTNSHSDPNISAATEEKPEWRATDDAEVKSRRRQYNLIRELRKLEDDVKKDPGKAYSYEEWMFYLRLSRRAESCSSYVRLHAGRSEDPDDTMVDTYIPENDNELQEQGGWSWIGKLSPLMGHKDEPEWLFNNLSLALERELKTACEDVMS